MENLERDVTAIVNEIPEDEEFHFITIVKEELDIDHHEIDVMHAQVC